MGRPARSQPFGEQRHLWRCQSRRWQSRCWQHGSRCCILRLFVSGGAIIDLHLDIEQVANCFLFDAIHHGVEEVEAFPLIFDKRITLRHRPQANAIAQIVHFIKMFTPLSVQHRQNNPPFEFTGDFVPDALLANVVSVLGVIL